MSADELAEKMEKIRLKNANAKLKLTKMHSQKRWRGTGSAQLAKQKFKPKFKIHEKKSRERNWKGRETESGMLEKLQR